MNLEKKSNKKHQCHTRMNRHLLSLLLMLCMIISFLPMTSAFATEPTLITTVTITGVQDPVAGNPCSVSTVQVATDPENAATIKRIYWFNDTRNLITTEDDIFYDDHDYWFVVELEPNAGFAFQFDNQGYYSGDVTINGENASVKELLGHSETALYVRGKTIRPAENTGGTTTTYTVTVNTPTNGTVTSDKAKAAQGEKVQLTVTPKAGYELDQLKVMQGQTQVAVASDNSFTMPAGNVVVSATFKQKTYTVTVNTPTNGTVTADKVQAAQGEKVQLTVTPKAGYELDQLKVMQGQTQVAVASDNSFTMPAGNVVVSATFKQKTYTITVNTPTNGTVTSDKAKAAQGEKVQLTVTPKAGYELDQLEVMQGQTQVAVASDNSFTMPAGNVVVSATFKQKTYTITVNTPTNGTVTSDKAKAAQGEKVQLTVTPKVGYELDRLQVMQGQTQVAVASDNSFTMPAGNVVVSATFKQKTYTITVNTPTNGTVTSDKAKAAQGEKVQLTVTPKAGYELDQLKVMQGQTQVAVASDNSFTMPAGNVVVSATFKQKTYTITVNTPTNGTVTSDKAKAAQGEKVQLTVTPKAGYELDQLKVMQGQTQVTVASDNSFTMPAGNVVVSATFKQKTYTITVNTPTNGTVTADKAKAAQGEKVQLTVTPKAGYELDQLKVMQGQTQVTVASDNSFTMPAGNVVVSATFKQKTYTITVNTPTNGTVTADKAKAAQGEKVQLTVTPKAGYELDQLKVMQGQTQVTVASDNSFTMPAGNVVVSATFKQKTYTITVNTPTNGTVTADKVQAAQGEKVQLTVTPKVGYELDRLQVMQGQTQVTVASDNSFTMPAGNVVVSATFKQKTYTITVNTPTNGTVTADKVQAAQGEKVQLTVTPKAGYELDQLKVMQGQTQVTVASDNSFTMPAGNVVVSATFKQKTYTITVNTPTNGTVTADKAKAAQGEKVQLTVTPKAGYELDQLKVMQGQTQVTVASDNSFTMPAGNVVVSATFKQKTYTITVNTPTNGTVTSDKAKAAQGEKVQLTVTPKAGYELDQLKVMQGQTQVTVASDNSFTMPAGNVVVSATFKQKTYTITVNTPTNGTVTADKAKAAQGEKVQLTVTPKAGYELDQLKVMQGQTQVTVASDNSFTMPAGNVVVSATFKQKTYTITVNTPTNGTVTADKEKAAQGEKVQLTVTPKAGYELDQLKVMQGQTQVTVASDNSFTMPAGNVVVSATFKQKTYIVKFDANGGGGNMDDVSVVSGTYTLPVNTFTPPHQMQFKGWALSLTGPVINSMTITVSQDITLYAIWENEGTPHAHTTTMVPEVEPTCTEDGNITYYTCNCGQLFRDATARIEITSADVVIAALGHNYNQAWSKDENQHWHECTRCKDKTDTAAHTYGDWTETNAPTCTEDGERVAVCEVCEYQKKEAVSALGHDYSQAWSNDENQHWHECGRCKEKTDTAAHTYGDWTETKAPTCTEDGERVAICEVCEYQKKEAVSALGHDYSQAWSNDENQHWHECGRCKEKTDTAAHTYGDWTETNAPTCTEDGERVAVCEVCEYQKKEAVSALGHDYSQAWSNDENQHWHECGRCKEKTDTAAHTYGDWTETKAPTCTEDGERVAICQVCEYQKKEAVSALGHDYSQAWSNDENQHWHECGRCKEKTDTAAHTYGDWTETKAPTCTEDGERVAVCEVCEYQKKEAVSALGHDYSQAWSNDENQHWHECTRCKEKTDTAAHTYGDWTETKAPTCTEDGERVAVCEVCEYQKKEAVSALGHDYSQAWSNDENQHWHECTRCKEKTDTAAHTYGDWTETKAPTCTEDGERVAICQVCEYQKKEAVAALGHDYSQAWSNDENQHWHECGRCKEKTDTAAHTYGDWTETKAPTCTEDGERVAVCEVCEYQKKEAVSALGHDYSQAWSNDENQHWHECGRCKEKTDTAAHTYGDWTETKAPTCTEDGERVAICQVCEYQKKEAVSALGHDYSQAWSNDENQHWHECTRCKEKTDTAAHTYGDWTETKAPTCTEDGERVAICQVCEYQKKEAVSALGHDYSQAWSNDENQHWHECTRCKEKTDTAAHTYGDWTVTTPPTKTKEGEKQHKCIACGYIEKVKIDPIDPDPNPGASTDPEQGDSTDPAESAKPVTPVANSGDTTDMVPWMVLMMVSIGGLGMVGFGKKPANKKSRLNFKKIENFIQIEHWASKEDHHTSADLKIEVID